MVDKEHNEKFLLSMLEKATDEVKTLEEVLAGARWRGQMLTNMLRERHNWKALPNFLECSCNQKHVKDPFKHHPQCSLRTGRVGTMSAAIHTEPTRTHSATIRKDDSNVGPYSANIMLDGHQVGKLTIDVISTKDTTLLEVWASYGKPTSGAQVKRFIEEIKELHYTVHPDYT